MESTQLEHDLNCPAAPPINPDWWIELTGDQRWAIYHRLQELAIDCHCQTGQPLQVRIDSPQDLVQCWSVMRHAAMRSGVGVSLPFGNRLDLAAQLETCWKLAIKS